MAYPEVQVYHVKSDRLERLNPTTSTAKEYTLSEVKAFLGRESPKFLPILRAIQLDTKNDETLLVTTALPLQQDTPQRPNDPEDVKPEMVWAMGYVNREQFPGREAWLVSSLELYHGTTKPEQSPQEGMLTREMFPLPFSAEVQDLATRQLLAVLAKFPFDPLGPAYIQENLSQSPIMVAGPIHSTVASLLMHTVAVHRPSPAFGKYIFSASADPSIHASAPDGSSVGLPEGLIWTTVQPSDHAFILTLNPYIRSGSVMASMHSAGIRHAGQDGQGNPKPLVAFVFEGHEITPRTMHVEPEYRKKGFAKALVSRLLSGGALSSDNPDLFPDGSKDRSALVYSNLESTNVASRKTFEGFGAKWYWDTFWLRIDLSAVKKAVEEF